MITFSKIAFVTALMVASTSFAHADSILLGSFATGVSGASLGFSTSQTAMDFDGYTSSPTAPLNPVAPPLQNGTASTYTLNPGTVWAPASGKSTWVGFAPTAGPSGGADPGYGYYQFSTTFSANGGSYDGTMGLLADDTVEVMLNGNVIVPFGQLGSDEHCADSADSCNSLDEVNLTDVNLLSGIDANTITFIVDQAGTENGADPSGMDFTASLVGIVAPEPSTLLLLGTGLLVGAALFYRRRNLA